jgi:hypothetical protein
VKFYGSGLHKRRPNNLAPFPLDLDGQGQDHLDDSNILLTNDAPTKPEYVHILKDVLPG